MNAIGYVRVSTDHQAAEGVSLEAQRERIEAWARANEADLLAVEIDAGISGKRSDNRPGLQKALDLACREKAALVVYSLSRLSRSTKDAISITERLDKAGADLVSLSEKIDTTSAAGKMVFRMLAVLAEFERDLVAERTKGALAHIRAQGRKTGGDVPFGYDLGENGKLVANDREQEAMRLVADLRGEGYTLREIGAELQRRGITTKRGGKAWNPKTVAALVKAAA